MLQSFSPSVVRAALLAFTATALLMAGCSLRQTPSDSPPSGISPALPTSQDPTALNQYKIALAQHIAQKNSAKASTGKPQSMLRSVVVLAFKVDKEGKLLSSSIYRTNNDRRAEQIALNSLQDAAPLPAPPALLLGNRSEIEIIEGWLFNSDEHFQLNTIAAPQLRYRLPSRR